MEAEIGDLLAILALRSEEVEKESTLNERTSVGTPVSLAHCSKRYNVVDVKDHE